MLTLLSLIGENHNKQKYFDSETAIIPPHTHKFPVLFTLPLQFFLPP